jgi:D-sedoheptulose 7-phosphate isomerase
MTAPWMARFVQDYVEALGACLARSVPEDVGPLVDIFARTVRADRACVHAVGNGGSSAMAQIIGWELREILGPHLRGTRCAAAWSIHHVMEAAAQAGYEESAVRLLQRSGAANPDLVVLISASGNSHNVVAAARHCLANDIPAVAFTGRSGGVLGHLAIPCLRVDTDDQQLTEDCTHGALFVLLQATARMLAGHEVRPGLGQLCVQVASALHQDVAWIDELSSALAEAAVRHRRIYVVAPDGGALGVSVEHVAHNLIWDLGHKLPGVSLDVVTTMSLSDYTGMANDYGVPGMAAASVLDHIGPQDITILFAHDADSAATACVRARAAARSLRLYGWYGSVAGPAPNERVTIVRGERLLRVLGAQVTGHLLLRASRAKVPRYLEGRVDAAEEDRRARTPVAPLRDVAAVGDVRSVADGQVAGGWA